MKLYPSKPLEHVHIAEAVPTAFEDARQERIRQTEKWGLCDRSVFEWLTIIMEELGESSEAALDATYHTNDFTNYRSELVQTMATCAAAIENLDLYEASLRGEVVPQGV